MAKKKRVSRKKLLKEPDEFLNTWIRIIVYLKEHSNLFYMAITAIIILSVGISILSYRYIKLKQDAEDIMSRAIETYVYAGSNEEELEKALLGFDTIVDKYSLSDVKDLALIYRGHVLFDLGRYDEALSSYERAREIFDGPLRDVAAVCVGYCFEQIGEYEKAAETFMTLLDKSDRNSYLNLIIAMKLAGKTDEVKKYTEEFIHLFPDTSYTKMFREELGLIDDSPAEREDTEGIADENLSEDTEE